MREAMEAEYEFFKYSGHIMPSTMTASMWEEMAFVKTVQRRLSLYTLFALREQYKEKKQREKLEKPSQKARYLQEKLRNEFGINTSLKDLIDDGSSATDVINAAFLSRDPRSSASSSSS